MKVFLVLVLAAVILGAGVILLPPVVAVTEAIFDSVTYDFPPFLQLMISLWPFILLLFFAFGAYMMIRGRN